MAVGEPNMRAVRSFTEDYGAKKMSYWRRTDNWLAGIAESDHAHHGITHLEGLTPKEVQEAFDKTYGKNRFRARDHGTVIVVMNYEAMALAFDRFKAKAAARGEAKYVEQYAAKAAYYRDFEKEK